MPAVFPHGGDEGVTHGSSEGVGLESILIDDVVPFAVEPGLPEEAGSELVVFVVFSFFFDDGFVVVGVELVGGGVEVAPIFAGEAESYDK